MNSEPECTGNAPDTLLGIDFIIDWDSERGLQQRIDDGAFAIALSGGGHRATLTAIGALMAVVDRGLASKVVQISSVSGGSIANAAVSSAGPFETWAPGELDGIVGPLARRISRRGVLGWYSIGSIMAAAAGIAVVTGVLVYEASQSWLPAITSLVVAFLTAHLLSGVLIDLVLRRELRNVADVKARSVSDCLGEASPTAVDHVYCMTDLVLGLPVYVSNQCGGVIWRRLRHEPEATGLPIVQTFARPGLAISKAVRASAGFPGVPPLALRAPTDRTNPEVGARSRRMFLSDGGQWNNLATQALREDRFLGSTLAKDEEQVPRPTLPAMQPYQPALDRLPILVANGSAALRPSRSFLFRVPGLAQVAGLARMARILLVNTVTPRVEASWRGVARRSTRLTRGPADSYYRDNDDPYELVVDAGPVRTTARRYFAISQTANADDTPAEWIRGVPSGDDWTALHSGSLAAVRDAETTDQFDQTFIPTTLGRIAAPIARETIARSYLNTMIATLALAPLQEADHSWVNRLPQRLEEMFR